MYESTVIFSLIYLISSGVSNLDTSLRFVQAKVGSRKYFIEQDYVGNNLDFSSKAPDDQPLTAQVHSSKTHSLVEASEEDIKRATLQYIHNRFETLNGVPKVLLVRQVTIQDLRRLNLDPPQFSREFPLAIVMIQGDFEVKLLGSRIPQRNRYLIYVFDLCAGVPTMTDASTSRRRFEEIISRGRSLPLISNPRTRSVNVASTSSCKASSIAPPTTLP